MNSNFFPSEDWLLIRWDNAEPENANRGKVQPRISEFERMEIENNSEEGIKRKHRIGWAVAFKGIVIKNAFEAAFSGGKVE